MNAIIGMAYITLKGELTPQQRGYLTKIHEAGSELLKVINDILELSKFDAGKLGMESITFTLRDIFADNQRRFASGARNKGVVLSFFIAPNVPRHLVGDPLRLGQILGHLLDNAVRYTVTGTIKVSCILQGQDGPRIELRIQVEDTGPGMGPGQITALQRLFSGDSLPVPEMEPGKANGLGLLLAHKLAVAMGGGLSVDSVPGQGSTFSFQAAFGVRHSSRVRGARVLTGIRILAVDDEVVSLSILKELLENFGMDVVTEEEPQQAIALLQRADAQGTPFHLVILDWRMPIMDGVEMTRHIKNKLKLLHPPSLIMLSAYGWGGITLQAEAVGIDAFLHKPINESVLLDTIMNLLHLQEDTESDQAIAEPGRRESASSLLPDPASDKAAVPGADLSVARADSGLEGLRILVVEDNAVNQQIAQEVLGGAGIEVTLAVNGQEALDLLDQTLPVAPFAMVLMDLQMPVMDGLESTRRLRKLPAPWAKDLPVIAMTAHNKSSEEEACSVAGLDDYVSKPISVEELFAAIRRWLPLAPVTDEATAAAFRELHAKAKMDDLSIQDVFFHAESLLESCLHEGRMRRLRALLWNSDPAETAALLERLNNVLEFMDKR